MAVGIDATMEELEALKTFAVGIKQIVKNGKNVFSDVPVLMGLLANFMLYQKAVQDAPHVPAEAADLDATEAKQIVDKVFEINAAIRAA